MKTSTPTPELLHKIDACRRADKLIEHKQSIDKNGEDLPESRNRTRTGGRYE